MKNLKNWIAIYLEREYQDCFYMEYQEVNLK